MNSLYLFTIEAHGTKFMQGALASQLQHLPGPLQSWLCLEGHPEEHPEDHLAVESN